MAIFEAEAVCDVLVRRRRQRLRETGVARECDAELLERPAVDDREVMLQHFAGGHLLQQLTRRQALRQRVLAGMQLTLDAELAAERAPVPRRRLRDAGCVEVVDD